MAVYIVGQLRVTNWDWYKEYRSITEPLVAKHGGKYVVKGGNPETLEGAGVDALIVIEFPSQEHARQWHNDPDYAAMIQLRNKSGVETQLLLATGFEDK